MDILYDNLCCLSDKTTTTKRHYSRAHRLKAVKEVQRLIRQSDVRTSLLENSYKELLLGSSDSTEEDPISWPFVVSELLDGLQVECEDANKKISRSSSSTPRKEFVQVLNTAISIAERYSSVSLLPALAIPILDRALWCLDDPRVVGYLGDNIWKTAKDVVENSENRAQLSSKVLKIWVDKCIAQLSVRASGRYLSDVSTTCARRILILLSKEVKTTDVLAQRSRQGANTESNSLGYVYIIRRCCEFLSSAKEEQNGIAIPMETQGTILNVFANIGEERAFDIADSHVIPFIVNLTALSVPRCWKDRKQKPGVSRFVRVFSVLLPPLIPDGEALRQFLQRIFSEEIDNARLKVFHEPEPNLVVAASVLFSGEEISNQVLQTTSLHSVTMWLYVLAAYVKNLYLSSSDGSAEGDSQPRLNREKTISRATKAIAYALQRAEGLAKAPVELFREAAQGLHYAAKSIMRHGALSDEESTRWKRLYNSLYQQMEGRGALDIRRHRENEKVVEDIVYSTLSTIARLLHTSLFGSSDSQQRYFANDWQSLPFVRRCVPTAAQVSFVQTHLTSVGYRGEDDRGARNEVLRFLLAACDPASRVKLSSSENCSEGIISDAAFAGFCTVNGTFQKQSTQLKQKGSRTNFRLHSSLEILQSFNCVFGRSAVSSIGGCEPSKRKPILERNLFPVGGAWFKELFPYCGDNRSNSSAGIPGQFVLDNGTRTRMSKLLSDVIADYEQRLNEMSIEPSSQSENDAGNDTTRHFDTINSELEEPRDSLESNQVAGACQMVSFIAEYSILVVRHLMSANDFERTISQGDVLNPEVLGTLRRLIQRLGKTDATLLTREPDIVGAALGSCLRLHTAFCNEEYSQTASGSLTSLSDTIKESVTEIFENLTGGVVSILKSESQRALKRVTWYLNIASPEKRGIGRKESRTGQKRRLNQSSQRPKKKVNVLDSVTGDGNDSSGFYEEEEVGGSATQLLHSDSFGSGGSITNGDTWNFGESHDAQDETENLHLRGQTVSNDPEKAYTSVDAWLSILEHGMQEFPGIIDSVVLNLGRGLHELIVLERESKDILQDAPSCIASRIVHPTYLRIRTRVWKTLMVPSSLKGAERAVEDVIEVASKLSILSSNGVSVCTYWSERFLGGVKGNKNLLSQDYESIRQTILEVIMQFLFRCIALASRDQHIWTSDVAGKRRRLLEKVLVLIDRYRSRDGFKMPRTSRVLFAGCIAAALELTMGPRAERTLEGSGGASGHRALVTKFRGLKSTFQKLQCDLDAGVRLAVAGLVPIMPRLERLAFNSVFVDDLLIHLPTKELGCGGANRSAEPGEEGSDSYEILTDGTLLPKKVSHAALSDALLAVGQAARSRTAMVALGELAAVHEDCRALALYHILARCPQETRHIGGIDFSRGMLTRLAVRCGHNSGRSLFRAYAQPVLAFWAESIDDFFTFPAEVLYPGKVEAALCGFVKEHLKILLPVLLLKDSGSFSGLSKLAKIIGTKSDTIIRDNIDAVFRIYPCYFSGVSSVNHKGARVWQALRQKFSDLGVISSRRTYDIIAALLSSVSAGDISSDIQPFSNDAAGNQEYSNTRFAFERDSRDVKPPFFDALVIGQAMERFLSPQNDSSDLGKLISSRALVGPLFQDVDSAPSELPRSCEFMRRNKVFVAVVMDKIWQSIQGPPGPTSIATKKNAIFSMGFLWRLLGGNILAHSLTRSLFIHVLLLALRYKCVSPHALNLLMRVTRFYTNDVVSSKEIRLKSTKGASSSHRWDSLLSQVVPGLTCIVYSNESIQEKVTAILRELFKGAMKCEECGVVASLDSLPPLREFSELNKLHKLARQRTDSRHRSTLVGIRYEMERFIGLDYQSVFSSHPLHIRARVGRLTETIYPSIPLIRTELNERPSRQSSFANLIAAVLSRLVSILKVCTSSSRENSKYAEVPGSFIHRDASKSENVMTRRLSKLQRNVVLEVSRAIGVIGSISTSSVSLPSYDTNFLHSFATDQDLRKDDGDDVLAGACLGILLLKANVTCDSAIVSLTSIYALYNIFLLPGSSKVLGKLTQGDADFFTAFKESGSSKRTLPSTDFSEELVDPRSGVVWDGTLPSLTSPDLWDPSRGEDAWIRQISAVLSSRCHSSSLRCMGQACFASFKLASALLPYMLLDVVTFADRDLRASLSSLISNYIITNKRCMGSITLVMLHALHLLDRERTKIVRRQGINGRGLSKFTLEIDGLDVAIAANRAGAHFAALQHCERYLEQVCKATRDEQENMIESNILVNSSPVLHLEGQVNKVMQCALHNINEPDGIHAVISGTTLLEASAVMAHIDSDWTLALGTNDALRTSQAVDPRRELSILQSLMGLGARNVLQAYWRHLGEQISKSGWIEGSSRADITNLKEERYHAAWAMGLWKDGRDTFIDGGVWEQGPGEFQVNTHQAIHYSLYSLSTGNTAGALFAAHEATERVALSICGSAATEAAKFVYECSGQLRLLGDLELAAQVASLTSATFVAGKDSVPGLDRMNGMNTAVVEEAIRRIAPACESGEKKNFEWLEDFWRANDKGYLYSPLKQIDNIKILEPLLQLRVSLAIASGLKHRVSRFASELANVILRQGGNGVWARANSALDRGSEFITHASAVDRAAWKIEEAKLSWISAKDGRLKLQAFESIKYVISEVLEGRVHCTGLAELHSNPSASPSSSGTRRSSDSARRTYLQNAQGNSFPLASGSSKTSNRADWKNISFTPDRFRYVWGCLDGTKSENIAALRAEACRLAAEWALNMHTDDSVAVFQIYLGLGITAFESLPPCEASGNAHFAMGSFADEELCKIETHQKTNKYIEMAETVRANEKKVKEWTDVFIEKRDAAKSGAKSLSRQKLRETEKFLQDLSARIRMLRKSAGHDREKLTRLTKFKATWRILAVKHYAAALREGQRHDIRAAFRLSSIWMAANGLDPDLDMHIASDNELKIPPSKLLPLSYQLSSRLTTSGNKSFQEALAITLRSMAIDYPYHCIWQFIALANSTREAPSSQKGSTLYRGDPEKADAATKVLNSLDRIHSELLTDMRKLSEAYIANTQLSVDEDRAEKGVPLARSLTSLKNLTRVHIPTLPLPFTDGDTCNSNIIFVSKFMNTGEYVGGINAPIRITCIGSDGRRYPQLLKGNDDLRQDAVMEQLFTITNALLSSDPASRYRALSIRTYCVVPLTPCSGVLQWVLNTSMFRVFLVDGSKRGKSAHARYRPQDIPHEKIQAQMSHMKKPADTEKRVRRLKQIWSKFQPVFRHFFTEKYPNPSEWYSRRLSYTRSVATASIVGYIIGLGDRHTSNILIDSSTAEIVHIDLGIAFEQGKLLPTPEKMPFRLTRDVVDGFGVTGVEGVFRSSCETTLEVLRVNRDILLTVFEVFLHDPLYRWSSPPPKVLRDQKDYDTMGTETAVDNTFENLNASIERQRDAQRVLIRIGDKLDGFEGNERLSIEAHVSWLIDEARNKDNIMSAFPGWMPWV